MPSSQYRIFVCTKTRSASDPDGSGCGNCAGAAIYTAFEQAIAQANVGDQIQLKASGCLDHCTAGPVAMVFPPTKQTSRFDFPWLPKALRDRLQTKIQKKIARDRTYYGPLTPADANAIVQQHCLNGHIIQGKVIKPLS
jgi:(2Fe-2S) ferredoxin